ncbi:MAG TPA: class I SAM-dependent methyltransferase [Bryobacteraceae bacterium]|nr:class I SAM-dependent methyltransferase [Bryobacteraceae bacterium]
MLTRILHTIASNPAVYDRLQQLAGCKKSLARLRPYLANAVGTVLDLGAGTGNYANIVAAPARYIWLDNDTRKLRGFRSKFPKALAILGDATSIPLKPKSVDLALCIAMSHHLADKEIGLLFHELAQVCRTRLIFLDPVQQPTSRISNILWKYDRGSYPRSASALRSMIGQYFDIEQEEEYTIYHHYLLCSGRPKPNAGMPPASSGRRR